MNYAKLYDTRDNEIGRIDATKLLKDEDGREMGDAYIPQGTRQDGCYQQDMLLPDRITKVVVVYSVQTNTDGDMLDSIDWSRKIIAVHLAEHP